MPVLGKKSPTPALPNLIGKGKRKVGGDLSDVKGMVVPQLGKLFTENIGHSGNISIPHPAEVVDLAKMLLPRGGGRMRRVSRDGFKVSQFKEGVMSEPTEFVVDAMYEFP
jgi:hypothetical protein